MPGDYLTSDRALFHANTKSVAFVTEVYLARLGLSPPEHSTLRVRA